MRKRRIWELKESSQNETKAQDKARRLRRKRIEVKKRDETSHSFQPLSANKSLTKQKPKLLDFVFLLVSLLVGKAYESSFNWTWREEQMFKSIWEREKIKERQGLECFSLFFKRLVLTLFWQESLRFNFRVLEVWILFYAFLMEALTSILDLVPLTFLPPPLSSSMIFLRHPPFPCSVISDGVCGGNKCN